MLLPQLNFWLYALAALGFLVVSFMLTFSIYYIFSWLAEKWQKRKAPKPGTEMGDRLLANPGKPTVKTAREVEDDEREQFARFREFEKLRRFSEKARESKGAAGASGRFTPPVTELPDERRKVFDKNTDSSGDKYEQQLRRAVIGTAKANKSPYFTRPEFL